MYWQYDWRAAARYENPRKTLWGKIGNIPCVEGLSALPLQMGKIIYRIDTKHKCMCVH